MTHKIKASATSKVWRGDLEGALILCGYRVHTYKTPEQKPDWQTTALQQVCFLFLWQLVIFRLVLSSSFVAAVMLCCLADFPPPPFYFCCKDVGKSCKLFNAIKLRILTCLSMGINLVLEPPKVATPEITTVYFGPYIRRKTKQSDKSNFTPLILLALIH